MSTRSTRVLGILALIAASTSACNGSGEIVSTAQAFVLVGERADNSASALLTGTVSNVDGCLGIDDTVVVWPHGTKVVQHQPLTVDIPRVGRVALGDKVDIGGGYFLDSQGQPPEGVGEINVAGLSIPAECAGHGIWIGG